MPLSIKEFSIGDLTADEIQRHGEAVSMGRPDECWPWQKSCGSHGYGQMWVRSLGHVTTSHRIAYVIHIGPIKAGMTIDHDRSLCRGGACNNPAHLRQLSNAANAKDNGQGDKTHCPRGHEYIGDNLYVDPKGHRRCRSCAKARRPAP